jgi:CO dehydrogenase/acetyl-CoA synthase beta subunit
MSIRKLKYYIEDKKEKGVRVEALFCPNDVKNLLLGLPFRIDTEADANIILKEDTFVELGPPDRSSFVCVVTSSNPKLLKNGRILVVGPDIQESEGKSLPIGQVITVAGKALTDKHYMELERLQYISNRLPGYMIRFTPRRMWSRVSKGAAAKGFSLEILGRNLMALYKSTFPLIDAMEILFVTSNDAHVDELSGLLRGSQKRPIEMIKERYGCIIDLDCADCPYQAVCDNIREIAESYANRKNEGDQSLSQNSRRSISK